MQPKILIVDDDARNVFALTAVLRAKGYYCISAPDVKEALAILTGTGNIKTVLLDMMMPEIDGYEAIPIIRKMEKHIATPIIAVTAQAMVGDRERCLAAGANDYVSKPINVDVLVTLLKKYI
ncbi:response regulator [Pinibacter aurantiacus]|uniref:Response regulator n=1 Tax=Pinibacter aurantiacus TaxID=2851599 RepID=A0A9E2S6D0_9BACT|nr:response regulator [Pinibacter aurantiacus]MBV4355777.1 response regulator [Pinibacter aurantiacus]